MTGRQTNYENDGKGIMFINKAWLEKARKELPTTTEEFLDVFRAVRNGDMNSNGDITAKIPTEPFQSDWCPSPLPAPARTFPGCWNAYPEQLKALQYDAWLQWYQNYLDGKF